VAESNDYKDEIAALGKVLQAVSDLTADAQQYVMRATIDRLGLATSLGAGLAAPQAPGAQPPAGQLSAPQVGGQVPIDTASTAKQFVDQKRPANDVERVTCLAFYLAHFRNTHQFKTADITSLNTEAAQKKLSNTSNSVNNAQKALYLTNAAKRGQKQITAFGEKIVNALPDREAVAAVIAAEKKHGMRRRKSSKRKKKVAGK
jgi:hypothetical protein